MHFNVTSKTIRRDLDILSRHYPIVENRDEREVRYCYRDGYKYESPSFTPAEIATLLLAQESISDSGVNSAASPFAKYGKSLLSKVRTSLPSTLREKLDAYAAVLGSATTPAKDFLPYWTTIDLLAKSAIERHRVILKYYTLARGSTTTRKVDPYCVYFDPDGATLKLIGFDHHRKQITPFAIDHIRLISETKESFQRPENFDLRTYLTENCFNGIHGKPITVRLRAFGVTARVFAERKFHPSQKIVEQTPGLGISLSSERTGAMKSVPGAVTTGSKHCQQQSSQGETTTIEMRVAGGRGLVRFILSWAPDVEVIEPVELRDEVAEAHRNAITRG